MRRALAAAGVALALARSAAAGEPSETLTVSGFGKVAVYAPSGSPDQVVLFVSGDGGWNLPSSPSAIEAATAFQDPRP